MTQRQFHGRRGTTAAANCAGDRPALSRPQTDIVSSAACRERARFWFRSAARPTSESNARGD